MGRRCPDCHEELDFLHSCSEAQSKNGSFLDTGLSEQGVQLKLVVIFAPFVGLLFDFILPLPSSILISVLVSLTGSAIAGVFWLRFMTSESFPFRFYIRNLKNFILTPNLLKIFGPAGGKSVIRRWSAVLLVSTIFQVILFTPGNAAFLEFAIKQGIENKSGAKLSVDCPGAKIVLYNEPIRCRVKTGILGISVPARATLSPVVGTFTVKVSLF